MGVVPTFALSDLARAFQSLLPNGVIWPRESNAVESEIIPPLLGRYFELTQAAANEPADSFPSTTVTSLPSWELALGLPDPCAGEEPTIALRQAQVAARFVATGGQSVPYFVQFAAALGYDITIMEFAPFRFGKCFGGRMNGVAWANAWQINAPQYSIEYFRFGSGRFGDPFRTWGNTILQCEMKRLAPAHTVLLFNYNS